MSDAAADSEFGSLQLTVARIWRGTVTRIVLLLGVTIAVLGCPPAVATAGPWIQQDRELPRKFVTGNCMGKIPYAVTVVDPPETVDESKLQTAVDEALGRVNQSMSTYQPDSDVSRFNTTKSTDWFSVDAETAVVVARALEISKRSKGAFDITVGPAVNLWKFGPDKENFGVPSDDAIAAVQSQVGYQKLDVRSDPPSLKKSHPDVQIDLSAIAKGYAVDQVAMRLENFGCKDFMVEVGGEVRCQGRRHTGQPWRVGVRKPVENETVPDIVIELTSQSLATSGDYENYYRVGKKRYSHTIDPTTCRPVTHYLASATVIAEDCMTADALATAAMVIGIEEARSLLEESDAEFYLVERNSAFGKTFSSIVSSRFPVVGKTRDELNTYVAKPAGATNSILPVFLMSAVVFGMVIVAMAVGAIFNNKPVKGSCGGLSSMTNEDGEATCTICSKPTTDCVERADV
ncbi:MAG: FAD:protein FMN transferase [Planctomycetota bacterium]